LSCPRGRRPSDARRGDTERVIEREREPVPISNAEWEDATREFEEFKDEWPKS